MAHKIARSHSMDEDSILYTSVEWKWSGNEQNGSHSKNAISFGNKRPNNDVRREHEQAKEKCASH